MRKLFYVIGAFVILIINAYAGDAALEGDSQKIRIKYSVEDNFSKWETEEETILNTELTVGELKDYLSERFHVEKEIMDISDASGVVASSGQKLKDLKKPDGVCNSQDEGKLILTVVLWEDDSERTKDIHDRIGLQYKQLDEIAPTCTNGRRILSLARKIFNFSAETTKAAIQDKQRELRDLLAQQTVPVMTFHLERLVALLNMRSPINLLGLA